MGDAEAGKQVFDECKGCHQVRPGAENRTGPHLNGLFGRRAASVEGFRYSKSFRRAGNSGLAWHADSLSGFLADPGSVASGTRMSHRGLKDEKKRAGLIAYLRQFPDNPRDIPEADPAAKGADHGLDPEVLGLQGDPDYGAYLSSECTTCHQAEGGDAGIPSIVSWPEEDFVRALHAYKSKQRTHPVMQMSAGRLSYAEIAALAAFFEDPG